MKPAPSRQYRYQLRHRAKGLCLYCPAAAVDGGLCCDTHREAKNKRQRLAKGHRPWRPGGVGRPPNHVRREPHRKAP